MLLQDREIIPFLVGIRKVGSLDAASEPDPFIKKGV
jgi:hypothetical protein